MVKIEPWSIIETPLVLAKPHMKSCGLGGELEVVCASSERCMKGGRRSGGGNMTPI